MEDNPWIAFCRHAIGTAAEGISTLDPTHNGLCLTLFLAGLAGSAAHCAPMCGPFVLAQASARLETVPIARLCEWHRIDSALALPYHLGRLTTYGALGAAVAGLGRSLTAGPGFTLASACLLIAAACLFFAEAGGRVVPGFPTGFGGGNDGSNKRKLGSRPGSRPSSRINALFAWVGCGFTRTVAALDRGSRIGCYLLGVLLGFLPCAFLYAALTAATATADPALGAVAMLSFGAGTIPALVTVALVGQGWGHRWRTGLARAAPYLLTLNGLLLAAIGITRLVRL